MIVKNRYT